MITSLIPSFNSGELSPLIHLRSDLDKYRSGCRTLQNFLITPYGGVKRRSGFAYVETAITPCRLFRFQYSADIGFVMEFGAEYIRFYDTELILSEGVPYLVATPYQQADLQDLQMVQINNIAYFTHPKYPVRKLSRISDNEWAFDEVEFSYPGMLEENLRKGRTMKTQAGFVGDTVTVESSFSFFRENSPGTYLEISQDRNPDEFEVTLKAIDDNDGDFSEVLTVQGSWTFTTSGTWDGTFILQRSLDNGETWKTIRRFSSDDDANFSDGGSEDDTVLMRIGWQHDGDGSSNPKATLAASGTFIRGLVKIDAVTSTTKATALVIQPVEAGTTSYWRESAWSNLRGFPRTVAAHEQRLVFAGTAYRPQTVWASAVDDYESFRPGGTDDDDSWTHSLASDQQNDIQWLISQKSLLIGTAGDEWVMSSSKEESIITPTNVRARRHSGNGSKFLKARLIDSSVIFVQRGGKKVRDMSFSYEADGYVTTDLTLLSEHITGAGVIDTAYQGQPNSVLWCVTSSGELIGLTYDKGQAITGWQRFTTGRPGDGFESVAVRSILGESDQIWVSVRRRIDGTDRRYIEKLNADGFFPERPWSLLFDSTDGLELWKIPEQEYNSFEVGFVGWYKTSGSFVEGVDDLSICQIAHTMDATYTGSGFYDHEQLNFSTPSPVREWCRVYNWSGGEGTSGAWAEGQMCYLEGKLYLCIDSHPDDSDPDNRPGTGADWATYWSLYSTLGGAPPRIIPAIPITPYVIGDTVANDFRSYTATADHTPSASNEPGFGASWETVWNLNQGEYEVGDLVSVDGINYRCIQDNTPDDETKPGYGEDWPDFWEVLGSTNLLFYVDSGVSKYNVELEEFSGLDHLEGETVQILANGGTLTPRVVTDGKIVFDQPGDITDFTSVSVGLPFTSILEPMPLEVGMQNGTSAARTKQVKKLSIYFKDSSGCKVSSRPDGRWEDIIPFRASSMVPADPPALSSGWFEHMLDARYGREASFIIKQDLPLPMQVLAIVPIFEVYGDQG